MRMGRVALGAGTSVLATALVLGAATGLAQTRGRRARPATTAPAGRAPSTQTAPARGPDAGASTSLESESPAVTPPPAMTGKGEIRTAPGKDKETSDAGVKVTEKGDGGLKQFKFGETEVEGRLKAPQIVYFLRRVRAEFAAGDLGHRSFLKELSDTQHDPSF